MTDPRRKGRPLRTYARTHLLVLLSVLAALAFADRTFAEASQPNEDPVEFDIPAQLVPAALSEFARQARVQLFFISDGFESIRANAVVGSYSAQEALDLLLAGTGLAADYSEDTGVKVRVAPTSMRELTLGSQLFSAANGAAGRLDEIEPEDSQAQRLGPNEDSHSEAASRSLEEILVTGSRIRGAQIASPVVTITRTDIARAGFATVAEMVDKLPQNFGAGASREAVGANAIFAADTVGGLAEFVGGTSVNLRGLGASSTLVLFNGRRMSSSGRSASFTDISGIPLSAIERVEVLTDGASAIYGSDAIAGVINFVMRDDYDGAETRLRYGSDDGNDTSEAVFAQSLGRSWDEGNILLSYEYYYHGNLANIDRDFAASNDLTRFGGDDFRTNGGNPANIRAGGELWAIPAGQDGTSLTAADFPVDASGAPTAPSNRYSFLEHSDMLPEQKRHSGFLSLSQHVGAVELFADLRISTYDTEIRRSLATTTEDIDVPSFNPFFVDPTGTGLTMVTVEGYSFDESLGPTVVNGEANSYSAVLGLSFGMGDSWNVELAGNWSREKAARRSRNFVDDDALVAAVNQTDPDLAFNPFADGTNTSPAVLDTLRSPSTEFTRSDNDLRAISANIDGSIFNVSGGAVRLATGVDFRQEFLTTLDVDPTSATSGFVTTIDDSRDVTAVYAELLFPFVTADNARPGLQRLELSLAGRYEDYSDFGSSSNPKVGLVWSPIQSLMLRGTWGTSFRAPQLTDLNISGGFSRYGFLPQFYVDIGAVPFTALVLMGGNEDLRPEEAKTWTAGFEWTPEAIRGLSLDMTYFNVNFEDRIDVPFTSLLDGFSPRFSSLLNTSPTQDQIAAIVGDPRYQDGALGIPTVAADILSGAAPVGAIMDRRINNLSKSAVTGVELQLSYTVDMFGTVDIGLNGNYLFDFERALLATDPLVDEVDTLGRPVDLRARGNLTWIRDAWSVSGFVNYTDGYTDNVSEPHRHVESWTTVDLTIAYDTADGGDFFSDIRLSMTAQNLFDEAPPFVNNLGGLSYDVANASGLGRILAFQVTKEW